MRNVNHRSLLALLGIAMPALVVLLGCTTMGSMSEPKAMGSMDAMEDKEAMAEMEEPAMDTMDMKESDMDTAAMGSSAMFTVRIEVLPGSSTPIAPVAWAVYTGMNPLFKAGTGMRIQGLEALAEDGNPAGVAQALSASMDVTASGVADTPEGAMAPGAAGPGKAYSFSFTAHEGESLSFATMYVQSNDLFLSPADGGLPLFSGGKPISGDLSARVLLFDAGTEVNEAPGSGPNQAPRQRGPNMGMDEMAPVQPIAAVSDGFMYPQASQVIRVTVSAM
jgi:hypothetical protein